MARGEDAPGVHFLHIGKTGGTSLKKMVKKHDVRRTGDGRRLVMHSHAMRLPDVLGRHRKNTAAFFLRDPVARFVSGFNSRLREGAPIAYIPWKPAEVIAFKNFPTPNDLAEALSANRQLIQHQAFSAMSAMVHSRMHFTYWLRDIDYLESRLAKIEFIGFLETYNEDAERLVGRLELPDSVRPEHYHEAPSTASKQMSDKGRANLEHWYAEDIAILRWAQDRRDRWAPAAGQAEA